jgi:hypothetical protein
LAARQEIESSPTIGCPPCHGSTRYLFRGYSKRFHYQHDRMSLLASDASFRISCDTIHLTDRAVLMRCWWDCDD